LPVNFKLKKIKRPIYIYIRNMNNTFNKERLIKYIVEVNITRNIEKELRLI